MRVCYWRITQGRYSNKGGGRAERSFGVGRLEREAGRGRSLFLPMMGEEKSWVA